MISFLSPVGTVARDTDFNTTNNNNYLDRATANFVRRSQQQLFLYNTTSNRTIFLQLRRLIMFLLYSTTALSYGTPTLNTVQVIVATTLYKSNLSNTIL